MDTQVEVAYFNDAHIRFPSRVIHRNPRHTLNPVLNGVRQVRYNLNSLAQVVTATLALDNMLVDFPRGDILISRERDVEITFVVPEIQIDLTTVIQHINLAMP